MECNTAPNFNLSAMVHAILSLHANFGVDYFMLSFYLACMD